MLEETVKNLNYFWEELTKISIILQRPAVQIQILSLFLSILLALVISQWSWTQLKRRFPKLRQIDIRRTKFSWQQFGLGTVRYLLTPILCLVTVSLPLIVIRQWGWPIGYLIAGKKILVIFLFYRLFLLSLYSLFSFKAVTYYRNRLFAPIFFLFVGGRILNWFFNLQQLSQISLIDLFGDPITLEVVFVIVAGLYFLIVITSLLEKMAIQLLSRKLLPETRAQQAFALVFRYITIGIGLIIIVGYVGVNPTALAAITGGLSVGIGFGLKEIISNFVSGIWLLFEGALKIGDIILIEGDWSQVTRLGIRATTVKVLENNFELIIPNQVFFTQKVSTLTGTDPLICSYLRVGTNYNCRVQQVRQLLMQIAQQHPTVLKEPAPQAFFIGFGDSSLDFELKFWLDEPLLHRTVTSELGDLIQQIFDENGIEIPYPQRDLHIRSDGNN